jgi:hypothetical protein
LLLAQLEVRVHVQSEALLVLLLVVFLAAARPKNHLQIAKKNN